MGRRLIFFITVMTLIAMAGTASAYDPGIILMCDAEGTDDAAVTQEGWAVVGAGLNLDVNDIRGEPSPIDVTLATGNPLAISDRYLMSDTPVGPLRNVEADFWFADDENKSPYNDFILTLGDLQDGFYRVKSYLHRADEPDKPCYGVTVSGAALVAYKPTYFIQDHNIMELPAEIVFEVSGGEDVAIRYKGPDWADPSLTGDNSPQIYFNGFTLEYFGSSNPLARGPSPADWGENLCPGLALSWAAGDGATARDIYFGTSSDAVTAGATPADTGLTETTWSPPSVELEQAYYWRVDEDTGGADPCAGIVWRFTTNDGNAFDLFPGDGWRGVATDVVLSWGAGCGATSHDIYMGTNYSDVKDGTAFIKNQMDTSYDPGGLELNKTYYWRIDERKPGSVSEGDVLEFKTGFSGVVLYYKFDGTLGDPITGTVADTTGNVAFTVFEDTGELSYAESNPAINDELGTSAWFDPNVGMYRLDTGPNDILLLNGYQYTIEMWVKANEIPDVGDNEPGAILFAKSNRYEDDEQLTYAVELRLDRAVDYFHRGIGFDAEGNQRQNWRVSASRGAIKENEWYHIAAVWDITDPAGTQKLYIDGRLFANARIPGQNTDDSNAVAIGMEWSADSNSAYFFDGLIDELRVSTVALGPDEFLLVPGPEWARSPSPYNKETRVDPNGDLEWLPGISAASHDIYFGASLSDVNASATPEVSGHPTNTYDPGPLEYGTTYYWRIDEVNGIDVWEGVVWWFRTRSYVDDPNLLLWYEFEETEGHEAWDSSGHDYIGEVRGPEENWDPNDSHDGEGGCLLFDNDLAVIVEPAMLGNIYKEITVSVWLKDAYKDDDNWVFDTFGGGGAIELQAAIPDDDGEAFFRAGDDTEELTWDFDGADPETIEGWHHWAFIKNENDPNISMYFDGKLVDSNSSPKSNLNYIRNNIFRVGAGGTAVADLEAKMDDLRVYDYALSERDVQLIFRLGDLAVAWGPQPFNGKSEVLRGTVLYWKPGDWADLHDVYFGTDFNDVNDADTTLPVGTSVYKGTHALDANTYDPGELVLDTTYYWRIDEVNEANDSSPWKGRIWRFKTANYLIVEDFESYGLTSGAITDTWLDGIRYIPVPPFFKYVNGAAVSLGASYAKPADPVHGGTQCMVLDYLNDGDSLFGPNTHPFYSETERTFDEPQDFTEADVKILTLFFYGDPNNDANASERMYVALHDSTDANTVVKYGHYSDEDVNDVQDDEWHQWDVALAEFTSVQLNDVNKICIGFGDRENPVEGGLGIVHFDDIRLYIPKCVPWRLKPAADFTDDCKVDFDDLEDMAHQWLRADVNFVDLGTQPQDPGNSGLVAWWKLEKIDSNVPVDYTGHGYDGVLEGDYDWVKGYDGGTAVEFDNGRVLVPDAPALRPLYAVSVSAWVYYTEEQNSSRVVVKGADNKETFRLDVDDDDQLDFFVCEDGNKKELKAYDVNSSEGDLYREEWIHLAGTFDGDANTVKCYINGELVDSRDDANFVSLDANTLAQDPNGLAIGNRSDDDNGEFEGVIDDVRLYSRSLSQAEVVWLATDGTGFVPLRSKRNIFKQGPASIPQVINLRDLAILADEWRDRILWPLQP